MKLRKLYAEISAIYQSHGDVDVILHIEGDDGVISLADLDQVTAEESHSDEQVFVRLFGEPDDVAAE